MRNTPAPKPATTGATIPDLILRALNHKYILGLLTLAITALLLLISIGAIQMTWDGTAVRLSKTEGSQDPAPDISGVWEGTGKDSQALNSQAVPIHDYQIHLEFQKRGSAILLSGTYTVRDDPSVPQRSLNGK